MVTKINKIRSYYGHLWVNSDKDRYFMLMESYDMNMDYDDPTKEWSEITEVLYTELIKLNK